jgi:hypothetical protein
MIPRACALSRPDFFATLGIPLRLGRDVSQSDTVDRPFAAVVSEFLSTAIGRAET